MDSFVDLIMVLVGLYLVRTSHQLITFHNLKAFYKEKQYAHIPVKNRDHYAEGIGQALGIIGGVLIVSSILYFTEAQVFHNTVMFWAVQIFFFAGLIVGFAKIYKTNKTYEDPDFNKIKKK